MFSEMQERVALEIYRSMTRDFSDNPIIMPSIYNAAYAAIRAMKNPTKAMEEAGWGAGSLGDGSWEFAAPDETWAAMIEAALLEPVK